MPTIDMLSSGILRFVIVAFVLLTMAWCVLRFFRQPLERVRLVQISLLTLVAAAVLALGNLVPRIDLALLPTNSSTSALMDETQSVASAGAESPSTADIPEELLSPDGNSLLKPGQEADSPDGNSLLKPSHEPDDSANIPQVDDRPVKSESAGDSAMMPRLRWAFVVCVLSAFTLNLIYLIFGFVATRRLVAEAISLSDKAAERIRQIVGRQADLRRIRFVSSSQIRVPLVSGIWHPTVILPERLLEDVASELDLRHSVLHELGHIERNDVLTWQLASLCQPFLWMQPCYWILKRELRIAQDQLADQFAAQRAADPAAYAMTLLKLTRERQLVLPGTLTMTGGKSNLYRRIEMLLNERFQMASVTRKAVVLFFATAIGIAGILLTSLRLANAAHAAPANVTDQPGPNAEAPNETPKSAEQGKPAEHSGVVIDADTNKPIEGVTVTVTRMNSEDWRELAVTESLTDKNGRYTFTIPPEQLSQRLLYIMFDIDHPEYAGRHCGSYGYSMIADNIKNGETPWFSEFKMVRGEKITGRLVDKNQRPIAGAQIRCGAQPKSGYDRVRSTSLDGLSDKEGRFEFVAPHDGLAKISVVPRDYCMKHIDLGEKRGDIGDIRLARGFEIHGVVRDAKGTPMSGLWVNLTPEEDRQEASYEMKRSCKTNRQGEFRSRPLKLGNYLAEVETKATGALEKQKYANFHNTPPQAMFVEQTINVTEDAARVPYIIQAVPHVLIRLNHFKPTGEVSGGHSPSMFGNFDGRRIWIRKGRKTGQGAYELMAPHGLEDVELRFTTNAHSALKVQFEGDELLPQNYFRFERLEADIENIRVVRYSAGILKVKIVDEDGRHLKDARIYATYPIEEKADDRMRMGRQIGFNREEGLYRLSSLIPGTEFSVTASMVGFEQKTEKFTMTEGERKTVTIALKKEAASSEAEAE